MLPMKTVFNRHRSVSSVLFNDARFLRTLYFETGKAPMDCHKKLQKDYYRYSALGLVWAETRAQSSDWYGSGALHPGQVLRGSLPLFSPRAKKVHGLKVVENQ